MRFMLLFVCVAVRDERLRAGFKVGRRTAQHVRSRELIYCARVILIDDLLVEPKSAA